MDIALYLMLALIVPIVGLVVYIFVKLLFTNKVPDSSYTPFDAIMGQSPVEFHEEKEAKEEDDDQGDGNGKNSQPKRMRYRLPE
ncbi:DUF3951 domain-containing protein [Paenibacillus koleovorans]|uniref:DUF3951 domain-containing protein n=1 Tax=Paenibacillus koleovorans TaxID=121608 RepID=UPI000FDB4FBF|nr:DUF3951 domain-containing protein [Paenibacillus koleovorans]